MWIQISTLPLKGCVTIGKLLNLSESISWEEPKCSGLGPLSPGILVQEGPKNPLLSKGAGDAGDGDSSSWPWLSWSPQSCGPSF